MNYDLQIADDRSSQATLVSLHNAFRGRGLSNLCQVYNMADCQVKPLKRVILK